MGLRIFFRDLTQWLLTGWLYNNSDKIWGSSSAGGEKFDYYMYDLPINITNGFYVAFTVKWIGENNYLGNDGKFQVSFADNLKIFLLTTNPNINGMLYASGC